jgi:hypothetical protein
MPLTRLGKLVPVSLRQVWPNEASDFTPWLAEPENLVLLSEALNLPELQVKGKEVPVGNFSLDILAEDVEGNIVVIENQFDHTDHKHLGQIMTYVAGQEGNVTVVWIAEHFQEEHRAAIDWLNANTLEHFNFFGVELELLKIGGSDPAPRFNVIGKPNEWSRGVTRTTRQVGDRPLSERHRFYLDYWTRFGAYLVEIQSPLRVTRPFRDYYCSFRLGRAGVQFAATATLRDRTIGVELYISRRDGKATFRALQSQMAEIESIFGGRLEWQELPERTASRIATYKTADPADQPNERAQFEWMGANLAQFHRAFYNRIRAMSVDGEIESSDTAHS